MLFATYFILGAGLAKISEAIIYSGANNTQPPKRVYNYTIKGTF